MNDIRGERGISLREVPDHLPKRRGKKVHYSTVYRWAIKGARGRKLESTLIGGIRYTTLEALQRFISSLPNDPQHQDAAALDEYLRKEGL